MPSHDEVAHAWAHQTGKQRNGKRMFYEGDRIYSHGHHFLIARLVDVKGVPSVLFTTRDYSVSTTRHKAIVGGACRHLPRYYVNDPKRAPTREDWEGQLAKAAEAAEKSERAHKERNQNHYMSEAQMWADRANALSSAFDLKMPEVTLDTLGVHLANRAARIEKARKLAEKARKQADKERFAREAEARAAWLTGKDGGYWRGVALDGSALLRVKGDLIETSQGASVPLSHAAKVFRFVKLCHDNRTPWHRNGHTIRVGHFQVDQIDAKGNFHAGCHLIAWTECERVAKLIGIADEAPNSDALEPTCKN